MPFVLSKGVVADDTKCFDFCCLQKHLKENEKNPEYSTFVSQEKLAEYFNKGNNAANHPGLLK
jgi:hypothetical protein